MGRLIIYLCTVDFVLMMESTKGILTQFSIISLYAFHHFYSNLLNGSNYAQWAQAVEVFILGSKKFNYRTEDLPLTTDSKYVDWITKDAQIRSFCGTV
jgi:hypothetical protein